VCEEKTETTVDGDKLLHRRVAYYLQQYTYVDRYSALSRCVAPVYLLCARVYIMIIFSPDDCNNNNNNKRA